MEGVRDEVSNDPAYLRQHQYRDASDLNARAALHARFSVNLQGFTRWLFEALDLSPNARILEVGGGPGFLWRSNLNRIPKGWRITLSDFSPGMVRAARAALRDGPFHYEVADATAIPHPDRALDAVLANHMLYHVPHRPRAIAELVRVLRPEGALYPATNGLGHMRQIDELLRRHGPDPGDDKWSQAFRLENGSAQLRASFGEVELRRYEDRLEVLEPEPVLAYALSMVPRERLDVQAMRREVARAIERDGVFHVKKATGLFIARAPIQSSP